MKSFITLFVILFVGCLVYLGNFMRMTPYQEAKLRVENDKSYLKVEDSEAGVALYTRGNEYIRIVDLGDNVAPIVEEKIIKEIR